jgi:hypothetical protein
MRNLPKICINLFHKKNLNLILFAAFIYVILNTTDAMKYNFRVPNLKLIEDRYLEENEVWKIV